MHGYKITSTIYKISNRDFYLLLQHTIQKKIITKMINKRKGEPIATWPQKWMVVQWKQKDKDLQTDVDCRRKYKLSILMLSSSSEPTDRPTAAADATVRQ